MFFVTQLFDGQNRQVNVEEFDTVGGFPDLSG